jgi:hypothetical protein
MGLCELLVIIILAIIAIPIIIFLVGMGLVLLQFMWPFVLVVLLVWALVWLFGKSCND